jgi:hypothetical protein
LLFARVYHIRTDVYEMTIFILETYFAAQDEDDWVDMHPNPWNENACNEFRFGYQIREPVVDIPEDEEEAEEDETQGSKKRKNQDDDGPDSKRRRQTF